MSQLIAKIREFFESILTLIFGEHARPYGE